MHDELTTESLRSTEPTITDEEIHEALRAQGERPANKPFARWKTVLIIVGVLLLVLSIATSIVLGALLLHQGGEIVKLQNTGNALAASNKTLSIAALNSQNNHHSSTVTAEKAAAAQANQIISLQMQLLAAHGETDTLLSKLTLLTAEAATLGPELTQGQQALLDNIAAIDFQIAGLKQQDAMIEEQITALQATQASQARQTVTTK